jgi:hypothetical protein
VLHLLGPMQPLHDSIAVHRPLLGNLLASCLGRARISPSWLRCFLPRQQDPVKPVRLCV